MIPVQQRVRNSAISLMRLRTKPPSVKKISAQIGKNNPFNDPVNQG